MVLRVRITEPIETISTWNSCITWCYFSRRVIPQAWWRAQHVFDTTYDRSGFQWITVNVWWPTKQFAHRFKGCATSKKPLETHFWEHGQSLHANSGCDPIVFVLLYWIRNIFWTAHQQSSNSSFSVLEYRQVIMPRGFAHEGSLTERGSWRLQLLGSGIHANHRPSFYAWVWFPSSSFSPCTNLMAYHWNYDELHFDAQHVKQARFAHHGVKGESNLKLGPDIYTAGKCGRMPSDANLKSDSKYECMLWPTNTASYMHTGTHAFRSFACSQVCARLHARVCSHSFGTERVVWMWYSFNT